MKRCTKCSKEFPATLEFFSRHRGSKDGLRWDCKSCRCKENKRYNQKSEVRKRKRKWYQENRVSILESHKKYQQVNTEKILARAYLRKYGITLEQYDTLLEQQGNRCAICGRHQIELVRRLNVDHDHNTGEIRGLLCRACNHLLGNARDNTVILQTAIDYLGALI